MRVRACVCVCVSMTMYVGHHLDAILVNLQEN